ncbi:MAG TPA: helix-turn-helix domain-containing protein [Thermoleophilaceae bacterium]|jgi:AcrR family transcriptional regulator|nr:helix-turn-helix domain-containing protein [Thermoleophilaceae bacterium]
MTRSRLLDAALQVCARRGIHAASVEEIADRAGYSTGAIYSNYDGKEGLLLALFEERLEPRIRQLGEPLIDAATAAEQAEAMAKFTRELLNEERPYLLLLCEFWSYAARSPRLRRRFARVRRERRAAIEAMIEQRVSERRIPLSRAPAELAAGFVALGVGVLFESLVDPELDGEALHASLFELLSRAAVERSSSR